MLLFPTSSAMAALDWFCVITDTDFTGTNSERHTRLPH